MSEAYKENGSWKPWRHPDYRASDAPLQGWWRHSQTGDVIAVLGETTSSAGNPAVQAAKYDFNAGARGTGVRMLVRTLERDYERESDDMDPGV